MFSHIVVLALGVVAASAHHQERCPMAPGKYPFDPEKFQGEWNLVAGSPDTIKYKGKCGNYNIVAQSGDGHDVTATSRYTGVNPADNSAITLETITTPMFMDKIAMGNSVTRMEGTSIVSPVYKASIVATDYDKYALYVGCIREFKADTKTFGRILGAEIWTRPGVTLSAETTDALVNVLASYDVKPEDIKAIDQDCLAST